MLGYRHVFVRGLINMNIIGITGQEGVGKTNLTKEFEKENAIVIDIDKISKDFYQDSSIIEQTLAYLEEKKDSYITELSTFFDTLKTARKETEQLDDPIYKAVEAKIDGIIDSNSTKDATIVLNWELLPKTKYFNLSNYNVLLLPDNDMVRKQSTKKREILEYEQKTNQNSEYDINYQNYKYNQTAINFHDDNQMALLKDFIIRELNKEEI